MAFVMPGESGRNFTIVPGGTGGGTTPAAPVIISPLTANGTVGAAFNYFITAMNNPTSYNATGLPAGLTINTATGQISGTPTTATAGTNVTISATNALGTDTQTLVITIAVAVPVVSSGTINGTMATAITPFQISATNSPTSYAVSPALPAGLSLNMTTGEITGTPTAAGNTSVQVTATNAGGTSAPATLNINIAAAATPVVTNPGAQTWQVGVPITDVQVVASNSPTSYAATNLPAGVTINPATGLISGTPAAGTQGARTVGLTATNAGGTGATVNMSVNVLPAAPVITSLLTHNGQAGAAMANYTIVAVGATAFTATPLPAGLTFNGTTGVIAGTIAATQAPGPFNVTIGASNTGGSDSQTLVITIAAQAVPVIGGTLTASGTIGTAITNYTITASNPPITSYTAAPLPPGLSFNSTTGVISGTPAGPAGPTNIILTATNAGGASAPATLVFTVAAGAVPVINSALTATGYEGATFSYTITATNSPTSFDATGLPVGLSLSGAVISGTLPATAGDYNITLTATNASGTSTPATLVLTVEEMPAGSPIVHISPSGSPPAGPHVDGQLWIQSNNAALALWILGGWYPTQAGG